MVEINPLRVLIADDEPLAAERLQLLLARAEGAQLVGTASDGDSAINLTGALHPDVLLLDIAMPGRGIRGRGSRLFDEAGRSATAAAGARPGKGLSPATQRAAGARQSLAVA